MLCWIEGTFYQNEAIPLDCVRQAGELLARLHDFAAGFRPQADFIRPRLDWGGLFGENSPYHPGDGAAIFTAEQRIIFAEVEARVRLVMDEIGQTPDQFGLIHGDFIAKNWLFNDAGAAALDFDDCAWGYSLYDLAPALLQFKVEARYAALRAALLEGYSVLRPLDEADLARLEALIAARHLASCRWLAGHLHHPRIRERAAALIAARSAELARFLQTGFLDEHGRKEFF
jgi:Ser/Thr protein kinase RdoA (MazF antagonist)